MPVKPKSRAPARRSPNPIDVYVAGRIRSRRTAMKMTQLRLSQFIGISLQQIQKYETGANRIAASRLQMIARILRVPTSFFFDGAPQNPLSDPVPSDTVFPLSDTSSSFPQSRETARLNQHFVRIADREVRRRLIVVVQAIAAFVERRPGQPPGPRIEDGE